MAAAAIAFGAPASASPEECTNTVDSTVCEGSGSSSIVVTPGDSGSGGVGVGANEQNGTYGPAGNLPPVGN